MIFVKRVVKRQQLNCRLRAFMSGDVAGGG